MPYFRDKNLAVLHFRCVIEQKTLFSPSFRHEDTIAKVSHFHGENPAEFHIWCTMAHQQGFMPMYTARTNMLVLGQEEAPQSIKHIDVCRIHGEIDVTW